jgi:PAS domain S-box-containing protein
MRAVEFVARSQVPMNILWGPQRIQIYNEAHDAFMGTRHPHAFGRPAQEVWAEIWEEAEPIHRRVLAGEQVTLENHPWTVFRNGVLTEAYFTTYLTPIRDDAGAVAGELVIPFETTDSVNAGRELDIQAKLQAVVDLVGLSVYSWDLEAGVADWDEQIRAIWAVGPDVVVDRVLARSGVHPDDLPMFDSNVARALDPTGDGVFTIDFRVIGIGDGVERWVSCSGRTTFVAGAAVSFTGAVLDITERRRAEARLRESEERFRGFAENSSDVIWILDAEAQRLEYLNPGFRQTWGRPPEAALADIAVWKDSIHPEDRAAWAEILDQVVAQGAPITQEYRIVRPDGAVRWIRDTTFPILSGGGGARLGGIAHDISRHETLTVYLVEPHDVAREAKAKALRQAGHRVIVFRSEAAMLEIAAALGPGCVFIRTDDAAPEPFGLARALKARGIDLPVIFEANLGRDVARAIGAMKAGAVDVLQAPADPEALQAAVASALAGLRQADQEDRAGETARAKIALMTIREREVLEGLVGGGTNKSIARSLGISPRTVEFHRARVMERLGVRTVPEVVMAATAAGIGPPRRR